MEIQPGQLRATQLCKDLRIPDQAAHDSPERPRPTFCSPPGGSGRSRNGCWQDLESFPTLGGRIYMQSNRICGGAGGRIPVTPHTKPFPGPGAIPWLQAQGTLTLRPHSHFVDQTHQEDAGENDEHWDHLPMQGVICMAQNERWAWGRDHECGAWLWAGLSVWSLVDMGGTGWQWVGLGEYRRGSMFWGTKRLSRTPYLAGETRVWGLEDPLQPWWTLSSTPRRNPREGRAAGGSCCCQSLTGKPRRLGGVPSPPSDDGPGVSSPTRSPLSPPPYLLWPKPLSFNTDGAEPER